MVNNSLKELKMSGNCIGDIGGMTVAQMLSANKGLTSLDLGSTDVGHKTLTLIGTALRENQTLTSLNLDRPLLFSLGEEAMGHVGQALVWNTALKTLSLQKHGLTDRGCARLCDNLIYNTTLTDLTLASNKLTVESAHSLAGLLSRRKDMKRLNLGSNSLDDEAARRFSAALPDHPELTDLDISNNRIEDEGMYALAGALAQQGRMHRLRMWGNKFGPKSTSLLANILPDLPLYDCDVLIQVVDGVAAVAYNN